MPTVATRKVAYDSHPPLYGIFELGSDWGKLKNYI